MADNNSSTMPANDPHCDDVYLRIWSQQQESVKQRWAVITFFLTISFAIFGFSFQNQISIAGNEQRVIAVAIYWFSFMIYRQYSDWSGFLRSYLAKMEKTTTTQIRLQSQWNEYNKGLRHWLTVEHSFILVCSIRLPQS